MRRARSCRWWCSMLAAALSLTWVPPLDALLFTLTPRDRDEAVRVGRRSITDENWGGEWRIDAGAGQLLTVISPFHRPAPGARQPCLQGRELAPRDGEGPL